MVKQLNVLMTMAWLLSTALQAMYIPTEDPKTFIKKRMDGMSPLLQAIYYDDPDRLNRVLHPSEYHNVIQKGLEKFKSDSVREDEIAALRNEIIRSSFHQNIYIMDNRRIYVNDSLLHWVAGNIEFPIIKPLHDMREREQAEYQLDFNNPANFQLIGWYHPYCKATILESLLDFLKNNPPANAEPEWLETLVNQPGKHGFTPMHNAIIAALVCSINLKKDCQNDYSARMLKEHKNAIKVLVNYGGKVDNESETHDLNAPIEFTRNNLVMSYFTSNKLPFHIMHSLNNDVERFSQFPFQWTVHEDVQLEIETYVNTIQNQAIT